MNKEFIERIEDKVNSINILDNDPFVKESCKNICRALLVVAENENPPISDISYILNDANKTIELLKKFDGINKEKYNGGLNYIVIDVNNNQTLLQLIELLRKSIYYNDEANDKETTTNDIDITEEGTFEVILNSYDVTKKITETNNFSINSNTVRNLEKKNKDIECYEF